MAHKHLWRGGVGGTAQAICVTCRVLACVVCGKRKRKPHTELCGAYACYVAATPAQQAAVRYENARKRDNWASKGYGP